MSLAITLLKSIYIDFPSGLIGWLGWLFLLAIEGILLRRWWGLHRRMTRKSWLILAILVVLVPVCCFFLAVQFPTGQELPLPGKPAEPVSWALVIFAAVPFLIAGGLLGPAPAAAVGALSGLALALVNTHSPYTIFEISLLALLFSVLINQRYRTWSFRLLRQPLPAALLLALFYPLLFLMDNLFLAGGGLASRLDYAITQLRLASLATGGELLIAGIFAQAIAITQPANWGAQGPWLPAPIERSLQTRFLYYITPVAAVLLVVLMASDWAVAGNAARQMLRERMATTAHTTSETLPFFIQTGQSLISAMAADKRLYTTIDPKEAANILASDLHQVPFFRQIYFLDASGQPFAGFPQMSYGVTHPPPDELLAIGFALKGLPVQNVTVRDEAETPVTQISFIVAVNDEAGKLKGILIGRSDLASNPFTQPLLAAIQEIAGQDGDGLLIDDKKQVIYSSSGARLMETYSGQTGDSVLFYDDTAADGTRRLVYYEPVTGHPWSVVISIPASRAQQLALTIAAPLLLILLVLAVFTVFLVFMSLRGVTGSLKTLSFESRRIASGQLDHSLPAGGEDEVGQLSLAFEQMRLSLRSRLEELNRLLLVSQGVASSLEIQVAVHAVLESALTEGACSARVVLASSGTPELEGNATPVHIGLGPSSDLFEHLDQQVLELNRQQDRIILTNLSRVRSLHITPGLARPEALLALALKHENLYYGTLWVAYDQPHQFSDDEVRFLVTLAGQAALAAANSRLFQSAEIGRQRLAAILASTPDPVLVTDQQNRLLLSNPAAWQVLGISTEAGDGQAIEQLGTQKELVKLLRSSAVDQESAEVVLADGRVYLATASSVIADGKRVGRICVLRDVTHFKELDALKSEFVSTVSHDLRSPLTLMRGYATMLEMVGDLNGQQIGYVRKIINAVESMSRLVGNLLDLGRIEAGVDLQLEMVPLHDIVERVTGALQMQAVQKKIELTINIAAQTSPLIEADQALLQQAMHNLVENAIKYTESGGKVGVNVVPRQENIVFSVTDTGIGIAPVDLPRLFEKFFRGAQREAKKQPGTGLGLAIVKSIAERHGGKVWVESQLGKGSTFYMMVPLHQRQPAKAA